MKSYRLSWMGLKASVRLKLDDIGVPIKLENIGWHQLKRFRVRPKRLVDISWNQSRVYIRSRGDIFYFNLRDMRRQLWGPPSFKCMGIKRIYRLSLIKVKAIYMTLWVLKNNNQKKTVLKISTFVNEIYQKLLFEKTF